MNAKNIQDFIVEIGLFDVFSEVNTVDENNRDGTFECGTKYIDCVLGSEGILNITEVIEPMECD